MLNGLGQEAAKRCKAKCTWPCNELWARSEALGFGRVFAHAAHGDPASKLLLGTLDGWNALAAYGARAVSGWHAIQSGEELSQLGDCHHSHMSARLQTSDQ